jgi:DNA-binding transcriptional MerR regulator
VKIDMLDSIKHLDGAIRAMGALGTAALFGNQITFAKIPIAQYAETLSAGLGILNCWPEAFNDLLQHMTPSGDAEGPKRSPQHNYGPLYFWMKSAPPGRVRLLVHAALSSFLMNGRVVPTRSFIMQGLKWQRVKPLGVSMSDVMKICHVGFNTLRHYLEALGIAPPKRNSGMSYMISDADFYKIKAALDNSTTLKEAAEQFGLHKASLKRTGLLTPIEFTNRSPKVQPLYDRREVDGLLTGIRGNCGIVDGLPDGCVVLTDVSRANLGDVGAVCSMILDGIVRPRGLLKGAKGLAAVVVDADEVRIIVRGESAAPHRVYEAAERLDLSPDMLRALIHKRLLQPAPVKRRGHYAVTQQAIEDFNNEFVSAKALATDLKTQSRYLVPALRNIGVEAVWSPTPKNRCKTAIFRKADLPPDIIKWWQYARKREPA